jgi:hypothetical protein
VLGVVATHGHCFDGLASAVLFTGLLNHVEKHSLDYRYIACGYSPRQPGVKEAQLSGDHNVILDYRFSPLERLTWYFDHHRTAFACAEHEEWFKERAARLPFYFDSNYSSCTKLIYDIGRKRYGWNPSQLDGLVQWADTIDSANFKSAGEAIDSSQPAQRLVAVVEQHGDTKLLNRMVPQLLREGLDSVAGSSWVENRFGRIKKNRDHFYERVRAKSEVRGPVIFVDLTDSVLHTLTKFVTYALYPRSTYSVMIARLKSGIKLSVGYNPWSGEKLGHDISAMCARHGGGGHPYVGGISFRAADHEHALEVAQALSTELGG